MAISATGQTKSFLDLQNEFGGSNPISMNEYGDKIGLTVGTTSTHDLDDFAGLSNILWSVGLAQGNFTATGYEAQGFSTYIGGGFGTATDTSCDLFGGNTTWGFFDTESSGTNTEFAVSGATSNAGWTNVKVYSGTSNAGTLLSNTFRTSCSYSNPSGSFATWTLLSDLTSSSGNLYLEFF